METAPDPAYYVELDHEIDEAEGDALMARWQFGRAVLSERSGKQLPAGRLDEIAEMIGKSRAEIKHRANFASRYPTEAEVANAVSHFKSWHSIVNEALASTAHLSAEKDEWGTPSDLFAALDAEFGFTLDACAHEGNAKVPRYFGPDDDGLTQDWSGETVWMNPPYSDMTSWIAKAKDAGKNGATVVCLVPSRTDVGWFWEHAREGEIRFIRGRLSFVDDHGNTGPAPFPSVLVVFGGDRPSGVGWHE